MDVSGSAKTVRRVLGGAWVSASAGSVCEVTDDAAVRNRPAALLPEAGAREVNDCWDIGEQEAGLGLLVSGLLGHQVPISGTVRAQISVLAETWGEREALTPRILHCADEGIPGPREADRRRREHRPRGCERGRTGPGRPRSRPLDHLHAMRPGPDARPCPGKLGRPLLSGPALRHHHAEPDHCRAAVPCRRRRRGLRVPSAVVFGRIGRTSGSVTDAKASRWHGRRSHGGPVTWSLPRRRRPIPHGSPGGACGRRASALHSPPLPALKFPPGGERLRQYLGSVRIRGAQGRGHRDGLVQQCQPLLGQLLHQR